MTEYKLVVVGGEISFLLPLVIKRMKNLILDIKN
jgi:hypothetical protein